MKRALFCMLLLVISPIAGRVIGCYGTTTGRPGVKRADVADVDAPVAKCYPDVMSQPVKLSDPLILDARLTAQVADRSIAGQIEFWAKLGRALEPLLSGTQVLALRRAGEVKPLSACIDAADSPAGRRRVAEYLDAQPFPRYEPARGRPGLVVRIDADGKRTIGKFVRRRFKAAR